MKIAALADIHGNYQALITVLEDIDKWQPDLVLVLGDIINRGPRSKECLKLILEMAKVDDWHVIRGNHEQYVLNFHSPDAPHSGPDFELRRVIYWTYQCLSEEELQIVINLPEEITLSTPDGSLIRGYHASLAGDRIGIYPDTSPAKLKELADQEADLFLVGHTHQPLITRSGKTLIVNAGSVGLPFDGDPRPGYARITKNSSNWQAEIVRLKYDLKKAEEDYFTTGFIPDGGELADLVLAELRLNWPQLQMFFQKYDKSIRSGEISIKDAVQKQLLDPNIEYKIDHPARG